MNSLFWELYICCSIRTPTYLKQPRNVSVRATHYPLKTQMFQIVKKRAQSQTRNKMKRSPFIHPWHTLHTQWPQVIPSMYMPYIEGPRMDWSVNDGLYHRFLKWRLKKCINILECELATLPEKQECKKVIAWSRDFGMDQYVS